MKYLGAACAAALALGLASPASALIVFGTGSGVVQPEENVLFNEAGPQGLAIIGETNQSATLVAVSGGETLRGRGGQARVQAVEGMINTGFSFNGQASQLIGVDLVDGAKAFQATEFKLQMGDGNATQITFTLFDTDGNAYADTFAYPANGFFYAYATGDTLIDRFSVAANGSFRDIRQLRLGGVVPLDVGVHVNPNGIPEPASWALMILGFGGAGAALRRRRGAAAAA
jgi:hypothetical protein